MTTPESRWGRRGHQARSVVTQDLILDAAEELFGERGIDATSVVDVAERADRSIGSLYHHFDTKELLVHAVVDRLIDGIQAEIDDFFAPNRWESRPALHIVRGYLRGTLGLDRSRPGYKRIGRELSMMDAETLSRYRGLRQRTGDGLRSLLLTRKDEFGHPDPKTGVRLVADMCTAMVAARVDRDTTPTQLSRLSDEKFVKAMLEAVAAILQIDPED
ncbi:MAG: helix-turn-helix domain-containing protein [Actinomycetota bacterium]